MSEPVVSLRDIWKSFNGQDALNGIDLDVRDGEFLTLLGPSGCGKTTVLRTIGGFEACDRGQVFIDGRDMKKVPPEARPVNTVFQDYGLFPHMSVFDNVAFGLRMSGTPEKVVGPAVEEVLGLVCLPGMGGRWPSELSGGQRQRVAMARAIVNRPRVLLLDEPLSALDYRLRKSMQKELKELQRTLGITFVLVTHDQDEAFTMSDRVVVMNHGRIEQTGTPREVYEEPVNLYVARFVGEINVLQGFVRETRPDAVLAEVEGVAVSLRTERAFSVGDPLHILLRPEDFRVEEYSGPGRNGDFFMPGHIENTYYKGATYDLDVVLENGTPILVTQFFDEDSEGLAFHVGDKVSVGWFKGWEVVLPYEE